MKVIGRTWGLLGLFLILLLSGFESVAAPPRAHHLYISGSTPGPNPAYAGTAAMKRGSTLRVWYTYADPDGNPESGTTFQWFRYDDNFGTNKTAIPGATGVTYTLNAGEEGKHISVEVRPRDNTGTFGAIVEFRPWSAVNPNPVYVFNANCLTPSGVGNPTPGNLVIPVSPGVCSPRTIQWQVEYTGINYRTGLDPRIIILWGDVAAPEVLTPSLVNPLATQLDTFNIVNMSNQKWRVTPTHIFDYAGGSTPSATANERCTYTMQATWGFGATSCQLSGVQTQKLSVWDNESNTNLGQLDVSRHASSVTGVESGEITNVCQGDGGSVFLADQSDFNCTPGGAAIETVLPNDQPRWVQFVYGTTSTVTAPGGVGGSIIINGVSYNSTQLPIYGPVQYLPASVTTPSAISQSIQMPSVTGVAGQNFVVTMRTWNTCAPFDINVLDGNGLNPPQIAPFNVFDIYSPLGTVTTSLGGPPFFANRAPATRTYTIAIITKPNPPVATNKDFCAGTVLNPPNVACGAITAANQQISFELTAGSVAGSSTIDWYFGNPLSGGVLVTNNYGTNCRFFRPGSLSGAGAQGTMRSAMFAGTPGVYSMWARYSIANGCVSDPVEVTLTIRPTLTKPVAPVGNATVCNGTSDAYALAAPPDRTIPINTITNTAPVTFQTRYVWSSGAGVSFSPNPDITGNNTVSFAIAPEPNPSTGRSIGAALEYRTAVTSGSFCQTAAPNNNLAVTVFGVSNAGTISPATQTICDGGAITGISIAGQRGSVVGWEKSVNGAPFAADGTLGVANPITPPVPIIGGVQTNYRYRAIVQNGPCATATSGIATIVVNPRPTSATITGNATICQGSSTNLVVTIVGGTSPYTVTYNDGTSNFVVNNYVSGTNIPVSPATTRTYTLVSVTDAAGPPACTPLSLSGSATVTISNPTSATLAGTANICPLATTNLTVTIAGGAGASPYTVNYTANGVPQAPIVGYISGANIPVTPAVTTTYILTSVVDTNGCPALSLLPAGGVVVTVGSVPTTATFAGGGSVCLNGSLNLTLTITGGVSPYTVTIPGINMVGLFPLGYTSGANIPVPTSSVGTTNYNVTFVSDACGNALAGLVSGNPQAVTVNPFPTANNSSEAAVCSQTTINVNPAPNITNGVASTFSWTATYPGGLTGGAANGTGNINTGPLVNLTGGQLSATFTVTPTSVVGTCPGPTYTITQPVNPQPVSTNKTMTSVCSGVAFSFDPQTLGVNAAGGNNVPSTFTWTSAYAPGLTVLVTGTGTGNVAETIQNLTGGALNATYTITPRAVTGNCLGNTFTFTVPINPQPVSTNKTMAAVCSGTAFSFNPQVVGINAAGGNSVPSTFTWTAAYDPGLTGGAASGSGNITGTLLNTTGGALNAVYTVTPTSSAGSCVGNAFTITVPINAQANVTAQPAASTVSCATDLNVTISVTATGPGITFQWQEKVGAAAFANISNGVFGGVTYAGATTSTLTLSNVTTLMNTNQYRVIMTTTGSCLVTSNISTLTVNPLPTVVNQTPTVCSAVPGGNQQVVNLTSLNTSINAGAGATVTITWFQDYDIPTRTFSNPILPGGAFGQDQQYQVTNGEDLFARVVTNATGCTNWASAVYTVRPMPNNNQIKDGTGTTISTVPTSPAPYNICASGSSILFQTDDTINPGSSFSWTVPAVSYPGEFVTVTASANILVMRFPNPTEAPAASLYNGGIPISVTETLNGCPGNTVTMLVRVLAAPSASVISGDALVCENGSANYSVPFTAGSTYSWTLPTGAVITSLPVTANAITVQMGTISGSVTVVESNGTCLSPPAAPFPVTVAPRPVLSSTVNPICSGANVNTGVSLSATIPGSTFNWSVLSIAGTISGVNVGDNASGALSISQTPINTSGVAASISYQVTPIGPAPSFCAGTPAIIAVTVNPEPVLSLVPKTVCAGTPAQYEIKLTPLNLPAGTRFSWAAPVMSDASVQGSASGGLVPMGAAGTIHINDAFVNNSTTPITATYTISAQSGAGCNSTQPVAAREVVITINPVPVGANIVRVAQCSNSLFSVSSDNITNGLGTGAGTTFTWVRDPLPPGLTQVTAGTGSGNISERLRNLTGGPLTATYVVTPLSSLGCTGATYVISVPINPEPVGADVTRAAQCSNIAFSVSADNISNGLGATSTYSWVRNALPLGLTQVVAGTGTGAIAETLQNLTSGQLIATYTVTPTSSAGCAGASYIVSVPVDPQPVGANANKAAQCSGIAFNFNPQADISNSVNSTFTWTASYDGGSGNLTGGAGTGTGTISESLVNLTAVQRNAVYTVTPTSVTGTCAGAPFTITVPINPQPVGANSIKANQCSGVAFSFNPQADIANGVASTFAWTAVYDLGSGLLTGGAGSGTGSISETLVNLTSASRSAVYTVTPTGVTGGCVGATYTITVPVNPQPVGANSTKGNQCSDVAFSFDPQLDISNGVTSTFTWTAVYDGGSGQLTGGAGSGTGLIAETLTNLSGTTRNAVYTVTPRSSSGLCFGSTFQITVPVRSEPVGVSSTKAAQCSGVAFSFNPQTDITNLVTSTFAWTAAYDPGLTGGAGSGTGLLAETLVNLTGGLLNAVYTVTPSSSTGGCVGTPFTVTVPVNPQPVGANATKANQCSGVAFSFNPQADITNGVSSTFAWTAVYDLGSGLLTGGAGSGTGSISETLVNLTSASRSAVYTVTPTAVTGGCVGATYTITVPVNPQPVGANSTKGNQCSDVAFSFDPQLDISNGVTSTFTWTAVYDGGSGQLTGGAGSGTGLIAETLTNLSGTTRNAVYTVTPRSSSGLCFGSTFQITVPVRSEPVGASSTKAAQCSGVAFSFNPQTDITNLVTSTFAWTAAYDPGLTGGAGSGTGLLAETLVNLTGGQLNAVYTVTPSSSTGVCVGTPFTITVPVNPQPVGANATKANQCSGVAFSFNPQADITNGVGSTFTWTAVYDGGSGQLTGGLNSGTGSITETLVNLSSTSRDAVYTVVPTSSAGSCLGSSFTIRVPVNPQPVGANSTKSPQCSNVAFSFDPQGDISNGVTSTFTWTAIYDGGSGQLSGGAGSGTGLIAESLVNVSGTTRNAVYTVTPRSSAGLCFGATFVITVPVRSEPVGTPATKAAQCSGSAFSFNPQTDIGNGVTSTFAWTAIYDGGSGNLTGGAGSGTGLLAETLVNLTGGTLNVVYTVTPTSTTGSCVGSPFTITVPITSQPVGASITKAAQCSGVVFSFNPQADISNGVTSTFAWTAVYDGGSGQITGGTGSGTGNISETLVNLSGSQRSAVYTVTPTSSVGGCVGPTFQITVPINPQPVGANFTRPAQCSNVAFSLSPDNITNGLGVTSTYTWVRNPLPAGLTQVIGGTGSGMIAETLQNLTGGQLIATYVVTPTSAAGCVGATYVISVPVNPEPVGANITLAAQCSNVAFNLSANNVTNGLGGTSTYTWVRNALPPGLTSVVSGVSGPFIAETLENLTGGPLSATYVVTPTSSSGCVGQTYIVTIPVNPQPVGANVSRPAQCSGVAFSLSADNISNGLGGTSTYTWVRNALPPGLTQLIGGSGSGPIAETLQNLTSGTLNAVYTVTPTSSVGCVGNTYQVTVPINPQPVGVPTTTVQRCSGQAIAFDLNTIVSNGVTSVFRYTVVADFPLDLSPSVFPGTFDRTVASNALISETFSNYSNHDVTLTYTVTPVSDPQGCTGANFTFKVVYHPEPVGANFTEPNCNTSLNHSIQSQITNGVTSEFTYVVTSSDEIAVPTPPALDRTVASDAFITDSFVNLSGSPVTVTYTIQAFNKTFPTCAAAATFTYNVTIAPRPVGISDTKSDVCSDVAFSVDPQGNISPVVASTFTWTATYDGSPIAPGSGVINATFNNVSSAVKNAIYTITPTATGSGCVGLPFTITIPIQPEPVIAPALAAPVVICSTNPLNTNPTNVVITTNGSSIAAANYVITLKSKDAALVGTPTTGTFPAVAGATTAIAGDTFTNTTAAQLTVVYTVVPVSAFGCSGNPFDITVQVNPEPVLSNPGFPAVCSTNASSTNIINVVLGTNGTSINASSYELIQIRYSNGGPFGVAIPAGLTPAPGNTLVGSSGDINLIKNDKFTNVSANPITIRYTIQGMSAAGCQGDVLDYDIVVNPEPTLDPLLNPTAVCSGLTSNVTLGVAAGSVAATSYNINSILFPGLTAGGANTGIGNNKPANAIFNDVYVNTTNGVLTATYKIAPVTAAGCVGPEGTVTLTINPSPDLSNTLNRIVCTNTGSGIVFSTTAASVAAASYNLISVTPQAGLTPAGGNAAFPANAVISSYVNADQFTNTTNGPLTVTYRVAPVSAAGCIGPQEDIVLTVEPVPTAAPVSLKPTVCSGSGNTTDLTDIELISPTNPSAGVITFNYTAVSSIGTQITGFVPALSGLAEGYKITDNLVNTSNSAATVTYTITPVAAGASSGAGCSGTPAVVVVTVEPKPKLVTTSLKTICEGVATAISLTSPTTPSAGTVEFLLVSAVATGGVTGASANGTVFANNATLNDLLSNPTTTAQTVTYTFRPRFNGGAGCLGDDVVSVVTVNPRPTVVPSPQAQICSGDVVDITLTTDVATTVSTWTVTAPATITGESAGAGDRIFQILFNTGNNIETVTYNVTPQAAGCAGTTVPINVTVNPKPQVLGVPVTTTICHGGTLNVPLTSNVGIGVTYAWTVDDPSGLGVPATGSGNVINQPMSNTLGFQATLTYTITATGPGPGTGCVGDSKVMIVTVSPEITASWLNTPSPDFICKGSTEYLVINIGGRAPFNFTYNDGGTPINKTNQPPVAVLPHVPAATTTYTLTSVTDGLGCTTAFNVPFVVNVGDTDPTFTLTTPAAACSPNVASFRYNQVAGTQYTWRFGDSPDSVYLATTTVANMVIKHTYTNLSPSSTLKYPVTLQTELLAPFPGCFKTDTDEVTIYPNPILNVVPNRTEICSGESVTFTNSSVGTTAASLSWSYRIQGQTAETSMGTTFNMTFAFTNTTTANPITYEVIFRASNAQGCPVPAVIMPIQVYRYSVAGFNEGTVPDFVNGESLVNFTNTSSVLDAGAFTYDWVFGADAQPANASAIAPATVRYVSPGPKEVTLTATNTARAQCQTTFTKQINVVLPPLIAIFDVKDKEYCFPATVEVDPSVTQITGDIIEWTVVDENNRVVATSSGVFPVFELQSVGTHFVKLRTSSSQTGQTASAPDVEIMVYGKPIASFDARPDVVFVPDTEMQIFNFSDDPDEVQFTWDFGDGDVLTGPNPNAVPTPVETNASTVPAGTHNDRTKGTYEEPIHIYKVEGIYDVTMFVAYDHGNNVVCRDTIKHQVQARQGGVTKVPNAFTPSTSGPSGGQSGNGSFNDVFLPIVKGADEYNLQIYDRWGNLIFESNSSQIGWDGYSTDGKLLPAGVYVYKLTVRLSDGQRSTQIGDVTMIR